jgi:hypothetical protein
MDTSDNQIVNIREVIDPERAATYLDWTATAGNRALKPALIERLRGAIRKEPPTT